MTPAHPRLAADGCAAPMADILCTVLCWNPAVTLDGNLLDAGVVYVADDWR